MTRRILFLGKRFYTNKDTLLERFGRVYQLPSLWARQGHGVLLWLVDYHTRESKRESEGLFQVISTPVRGLALFKGLVAWWRLKPDIVVASGDCYVGLLGWLLARLGRATYVFDIYDKYDEFAGYRKPAGFDLFGFLRRRADLSFYCSRGLQQFYADEACESVYIANGVDDASFAPRSREDCRKALELPAEESLIGYFGSMEADRGVADLIGAMEILRSEGVKVRLLVCGRADPALPLDQDWILFRGMVPHSLMPCYLNASDVLVVPYRESAIMDMGASCKIAEYLMCGRPLVSTNTRNFVSNFPLQAAELGSDMCVPGDIAAMAGSIRRQLLAQRVVTRPTDMGWSHIAARALEAMEARDRTN